MSFRTSSFLRALAFCCIVMGLCGPRISWAQPQAGQTPPETASAAQRAARFKSRDELSQKAVKLRAAGQWKEAVVVAQEVVAIEQENLGQAHAAVVATLEFIAECYEDGEDFPAAKGVRQQVLEIKTRSFGAANWRVTDARLALSNTALLARLTAAERQQVKHARELNASARAPFEQGMLNEAAAKFRMALDIRRELLGEEHPDYLLSLSNLAFVYKVQKNYVEAERLFRQALAIRKRVLGEEHPEYAEGVSELANVYASQGDYVKAEPLYHQALEIRKKVLGGQHPDYVQSLIDLAHIYHVQKNYAWAEPLYREVLEIRRKILGDQHPDYLKSLDDLAGLYYEQRDYVKAEPLYREALEIRKKVLGVEHPDYVSSLNDLAYVYQLQGAYARAVPLYREALEIRRKLLGDQHPDYATSLNNLALVYHLQADHARAEPLYREALEIRRKAPVERPLDYATSLNNLAGLYISQADYARAEPLYREALEIERKVLGERHQKYANTLNNLAGLYQAQGDYAQAEALYRQALEIKKDVLGEQHPDYAEGLCSLGYLYRLRGNYARAEPLYRKSLKIQKRMLGERHPDYALSLNNLAALYQLAGDSVRAEPLMRRALEIRKKVLGELHPDYAQSLSNLGYLYESQGDDARAEPLYRQALEIRKKVLGEQHPDYAGTLNNLAELYRKQGDYARAEPLLREALEIRRKALGERHPDYAISLNNLAAFYDAQQDYARSEPLYQQVAAIWKETLGEEHPEYATSLDNLAVSCHMLGDSERAESLFRQALEIRKKVLGFGHPDYALSMSNLAELELFRQAPERAAPLELSALRVMRRHVDATSVIQSERQQLGMGQRLNGYLNVYLSAAAAAGLPAREVYTEILFDKGSVLARQRLMRQFRRASQDSAHPEIVDLCAALEGRTHRLGNLSRILPKPEERTAHHQALEGLTTEIEELQRKLALASADFRQILEQGQRTPEDLQAALPPGTALVDIREYSHYSPGEQGQPQGGRWERRVAAFVVRPDRELTWINLGPLEPVAEAIEAWREDFGNKNSELGLGSEADAELRRLIWEPLEDSLADVRTVLISPNGLLSRVPWGALPGRTEGSYLLEERAFAVIPIPQSLPDVLKSAEQSAFLDPSLLLVGEVDYGAAPGTLEVALVESTVSRSAPHEDSIGNVRSWKDLPATHEEVAKIEEEFKAVFAKAKVQPLRKTDATEAAVRSTTGKYKYVHFATHGFFAPPSLRSALADASQQDSGDPGNLFVRQDVSGFHPGLLSGLVLTGANQPAMVDQDDGILTALELAELDLSGVQLATLSACETGLGLSAGGEGLLGLQRAFQTAGARSVVASLWSVNDKATRALMIDFYDNLWKKKLPTLEALRLAQFAMLRDGATRRSLLDQMGVSLPIIGPPSS